LTATTYPSSFLKCFVRILLRLNGNSNSHSPAESDQTQALESSDPLAILIPSGETSTVRTRSSCALNLLTCEWLFASHTRTQPSRVPLTIHFPSRDTATLRTLLPASIGLPTSLPFSTRQRRIFPYPSPLTTCCSSTRNATECVPGSLLISIFFPFGSSVPR
jgi:hypothetical protein